MANTPDAQPTFQPDSQYVIAALQDELQALNSNRYFLLATIRQLQAMHADAEAVWQLERESLKTEQREVD